LDVGICTGVGMCDIASATVHSAAMAVDIYMRELCVVNQLLQLVVFSGDH
jgi:hypothetical protein